MQAARGASLTASDPTEPAATDPAATDAGSRHRRALRLFVLVAVLGYALDLASKALAVAHLTGRPPVHVIGELLTLYLARNPGAAFSTGTSYTVLLTFVALGAGVATLWVARRLGSTGWALGLGFLMAGVLGNLTDRLFREPGPFRGHVVDFLQLPNWPIFNVADMCINLAAALIILQAVRGVSIDGRSHSSKSAGEDRDQAPESGDDPTAES
jgi:signal peptidase II